MVKPEPSDEESWYPEMLAIGAVLVSLITFGSLLLSMSTIGTQKTRKTPQKHVHQTEISHSEPYSSWLFDSEIVVTVGYDEQDEPITVHVRPVLAFNDENIGVRPELMKREYQLKSVVVETLANQPISLFREQNYVELRDILVNEVNKTLTSGHRIQAVYFDSLYIE